MVLEWIMYIFLDWDWYRCTRTAGTAAAGKVWKIYNFVFASLLWWGDAANHYTYSIVQRLKIYGTITKVRNEVYSQPSLPFSHAIKYFWTNKNAKNPYIGSGVHSLSPILLPALSSCDENAWNTYTFPTRGWTRQFFLLFGGPRALRVRGSEIRHQRKPRWSSAPGIVNGFRVLNNWPLPVERLPGFLRLVNMGG
jgi:hypothetical protein